MSLTCGGSGKPGAVAWQAKTLLCPTCGALTRDEGGLCAKHGRPVPCRKRQAKGFAYRSRRRDE